MSSLKEINNKVYIDDEVLIDFQKPLLNYSRLPLFQHDKNLPSLFSVLTTLICSCDIKERFGGQLIYNQYYKLIFFLFSKYMIRIPGTRTTRTVELGADNWILSYHLSALLCSFHPDNEYFLVTDEKNPGRIEWLKNHINAEKLLKSVTLVNSDYDELNIEKNSFDFVILNGSTTSADPGSMVASALNLVKENGVIIVFNQFKNIVFDDIHALKVNDSIRHFKSYILDDGNAEIIVIEV